MKLSSTIALKGLSRSTFCAVGSPACRRLAGHKGDHRATTSGRNVVAAEAAPKGKVKTLRPAKTRRVGINGPVGQLRLARRAKAAPEGTNVLQSDKVAAKAAKRAKLLSWTTSNPETCTQDFDGICRCTFGL